MKYIVCCFVVFLLATLFAIIFEGIFLGFKNLLNSKLKIKLKTLIPDFKYGYTGTGMDTANALHAVSILIFWIVPLIALSSMVKFGVINVDLEALLKLSSVAYSTAGTVWIAAGVRYRKPSKLDANQFQNHVIFTFASSSRHCTVGIFIFLFGIAIQLLAESQYVKMINSGVNNEPAYECTISEKSGMEIRPNEIYSCKIK